MASDFDSLEAAVQTRGGGVYTLYIYIYIYIYIYTRGDLSLYSGRVK